MMTFWQIVFIVFVFISFGSVERKLDMIIEAIEQQEMK